MLLCELYYNVNVMIARKLR